MEQTSSCGASEGGSGEAGAICAKVGGRRSVLLMSFWFGLVAGLLELLFLAIRVRLFEKGFFLRSRHFLWMVPLSDLLIFGVTGFLISQPWPRVGRLPLRVVVAVLLFLSLLCQLLLVRGLNSLACALFSAGVAFQASRWIAARPAGLARVIRWSGPVLATLLVGLFGQAVVRDALGRASVSYARTSAGPDVPNVLLVVMDTVRADDLSLYGYSRETSPNLVRDWPRRASVSNWRATAPWTLPSHASMFTGYWPHDLGVEQLGWLDGRRPTLAEVMRSSGYDTGGFVANTFFCGHESGLDRGFDSYQDYPAGPSEVLRASSVGWLLFRNASRIGGALSRLAGGDPESGIILDFTRKDVRG